MIASISGPDRVVDSFRTVLDGYEIARLPDGGLIVVWGNTDRTISARFYDAGGSQRRPDILVAGDPLAPNLGGNVDHPFVAVLQDGSIVITYEQFDFAGSRIFAKVFDVDGDALSEPVLLHTLNQQASRGGEVTALKDGGFAIGVVQFDGSVQGLFTQRFSAEGVAQTGFLPVNQTTAASQDFIDIAATQAGGHAVVWASEGVDGSSFAVMMRVYDAAGAALTREIPINQTTIGNQNMPAVVALANGTLAVVWHSVTSVGTAAIAGRLFNPDGTPRSAEFIVDAGAGTRLNPEIAALDTGGFVVAWENVNSGNVLAAVFDAQANQIVPPQALNTAQTIRAGTAEITAMDGNRFAALWNDFTGSELLLDTGVFTTNLSTMGDDVFVGDAANNLFDALGGEDTMTGGRGNDTLDGGDDIDRAVFDGTKAGYTLTLTPTGTTLTDRRTDGSGNDTLLNLEYLDFGETIGADAGGFALFQQVGIATLGAADLNSFVELYIAYFNRAPDAEGLGFWGTAFANGYSLEAIAELFIDQDETRAAYPATLSNVDFATAVYDNVLGRVPDQSGFDFWVGALNSGGVTPDQFILQVLRGAKVDPQPGATQAFIDQQLLDRQYLADKTDIGAYFSVHKGMSTVADASAAMALFDGTAASIVEAVNAIDGFYADALDADNGAFLVQVVGVIDDPFSII